MLNLQNRLIVGFLIATLLTGIITTLTGILTIDKNKIDEVQNKVGQDFIYSPFDQNGERRIKT